MADKQGIIEKSAVYLLKRSWLMSVWKAANKMAFAELGQKGMELKSLWYQALPDVHISLSVLW